MSVLVLSSIGILLAAAVASAVLLARSGEARVGLLTAALVLLAVSQGVALWLTWGQPLAIDAATLGQAAALAGSGLAALVVLSMWRTLGERDRIEALHWDSMETVRQLGEITAETDVELEGQIPRLLELGCTRFGLPIGVFARVADDRCEVLAIHSPEGFPIERGGSLPLGRGCFGGTLAAERPLAVESLQDSNFATDDEPFARGAYLGCAIRMRGESFGLVAFTGPETRFERFTATDKDLLALMARWIGSEMERRDAERAIALAKISRREPGPPLGAEIHGDTPIAAGADLNGALQRLDHQLRSLAGPAVDIQIDLADGLYRARAPSVPLDSIIRSLVVHAVDAMSDGGALLITTANVDGAASGHGGNGLATEQRFVTLTVSGSGDHADREALVQAFARDDGSASARPRRAPYGALPLYSVYRLLQRCGGDLSLEVEAGLASTFTLFLPCEPGAGDLEQAAASTAKPSEQPAQNAL